MKFEGRVLQKRFGAGSKSERDAIVLRTDSGEYVLRRVGGNAFQDPELAPLVGQTISAEGELHGYTLLLSSWSVLR